MTATTVYMMAKNALESYFYSRTSGGTWSALMDSALRAPEEWKADPTVYNLAKLIRTSADEIQRKTPRSSVYNNMKKIIRACNRAYPNKHALHGAWLDREGWQTVCDGVRLIRIKTPLDGLPVVEGSDMLNILEGARKNCTERLTLPDVGTLKIYIADRKTQKQDFYFDLGDGLPAVNADYLLTMLGAFPSGECWYNPHSMYAPLYFTAEGLEGAMTPVRKRI